MTSLAPFKLFTYEEFQSWFLRDFDAREELYQLLGEDPGIGLGSLDRLEEFLLDRFATVEEALALGARAITSAAARHVGTVIVLATDGAKWTARLDDPDSVYYQLPILAFPDGYEECPLTMVTTAVDRRTGTFMRDLSEGYVEEYGGEAG